MLGPLRHPLDIRRGHPGPLEPCLYTRAATQLRNPGEVVVLDSRQAPHQPRNPDGQRDNMTPRKPLAQIRRRQLQERPGQSVGGVEVAADLPGRCDRRVERMDERGAPDDVDCGNQDPLGGTRTRNHGNPASPAGRLAGSPGTIGRHAGTTHLRERVPPRRGHRGRHPPTIPRRKGQPQECSPSAPARSGCVLHGHHLIRRPAHAGRAGTRAPPPRSPGTACCSPPVQPDRLVRLCRSGSHRHLEHAPSRTRSPEVTGRR